VLQLRVNTQEIFCEVEPGEFLVDVIRDRLCLTGTHIGCDTAQCGACTVIVDGKACKSCNVLAMQVNDCDVQTIEGVGGPGDELHVMQKAFSEHHALQCGYCTSGLVMRAIAMAQEDVPATEEAVREALAGNICRCTGYEGIVKAVCQGITAMRQGPHA
jgi:aerobic carbon-monoxide dehydrogenase small subunit